MKKFKNYNGEEIEVVYRPHGLPYFIKKGGEVVDTNVKGGEYSLLLEDWANYMKKEYDSGDFEAMEDTYIYCETIYSMLISSDYEDIETVYEHLNEQLKNNWRHIYTYV